MHKICDVITSFYLELLRYVVQQFKNVAINNDVMPSTKYPN